MDYTNFIWVGVAVVYGLVFGSFFNVCIYRLPQQLSIVTPPSHCPNCKQRLHWTELIPVVSYLLQRGKCRHCGQPISKRYPLVELSTGLLFGLTYVYTGWNWLLLRNLILVSLLLIITMIDIDEMIIPHRLTLAGAVTALIFQFLLPQLTWSQLGWGFILGGGIPFLIVFLTQGRGMGGGDITLGAMLGLFFGLQETFVLLCVSFILGGIFSIFMLLTKRKGRKDMLPFGPFLTLAAFIMLYWGDILLRWYGLT